MVSRLSYFISGFGHTVGITGEHYFRDKTIHSLDCIKCRAFTTLWYSMGNKVRMTDVNAGGVSVAPCQAHLSTHISQNVMKKENIRVRFQSSIYLISHCDKIRAGQRRRDDDNDYYD